MKTLMISLALCVTVARTGWSTPPNNIKCPIMKDRDVDVAEATKKKLYVDYKGKRYFVCCKTCITLFKKNPEKYANESGMPTPNGK
jgi:YHS domain-containing protein